MLTDVRKNSLMACIIFCLWLRQTSRMVLLPEKVINPIDLKFFKEMCEANKRKFIPRDPPSDYKRTIIKTIEKNKRKSKSSSSDIPQLGAQKKQ